MIVDDSNVARDPEPPVAGFIRRLFHRGMESGIAIVVGSVVAGLLVGAILILWAGENPLNVYRVIFTESLLKGSGWRGTLLQATPLGIIGLGLAFSFRAGVWNIGAEGQLIVGTVAAIAIVGAISDLPGYIVIPVGMLTAMVGGAAWGAISAYLHVKFEVNAVIATLLMVFIAIPLLNWAVRVPFKDPASFLPQSRTVGNGALPEIFNTNVHIGVLAFFVLVPVAAWVMNYSRFGYLVRGHGANRYAVYANESRPGRLPFVLLALSGSLAGAAGFIQLAGVQMRVGSGTAAGFGFTAIIVAILGRNRPIGVFFAAIGLSAMLVGAEAAQRLLGLPVALTQSIQPIIVMFVVAGEALRARALKREGEREAAIVASQLRSEVQT